MTDFKTPRIKIVQGWPGMHYLKAGDILRYDLTAEHYISNSHIVNLQTTFDYPVHFKQLLWHEERTPDELAAVKYVKVNKDEHRPEKVPYYGRIEEWLMATLGLIDITCGGRSFITYKNCEPCTEEEYLNNLK